MALPCLAAEGFIPAIPSPIVKLQKQWSTQVVEQLATGIVFPRIQPRGLEFGLLQAHAPQPFEQERHGDADPGLGVREQLCLLPPPHEPGGNVLAENRQPGVSRRTGAGEAPPYDVRLLNSRAFQGLRRGR